MKTGQCELWHSCVPGYLPCQLATGAVCRQHRSRVQGILPAWQAATQGTRQQLCVPGATLLKPATAQQPEAVISDNSTPSTWQFSTDRQQSQQQQQKQVPEVRQVGPDLVAGVTASEGGSGQLTGGLQHDRSSLLNARPQRPEDVQRLWERPGSIDELAQEDPINQFPDGAGQLPGTLTADAQGRSWPRRGRFYVFDRDLMFRNLTRRITTAPTWQAVADVFRTYGPDDVNYINVSAALFHLSVLSERMAATEYQLMIQSGLLDRLIQLTMTKLREYKAREISNTLYALAKIGYRPDNIVLDALVYKVRQERRYLKPQGISNITWALATLACNPGDVFLATLADQAVHRLSGFQPQSIANTLYGFAKLRYTPRKELLIEFETSVTRNLLAYNPQDIANSLWAFVKLGHTPSQELLATIAKEARANRKNSRPQGIANILWCFATLTFSPGSDLLDALLQEMQFKADILNAQDISLTLWALVKLEHEPSVKFLATAASRTHARLATFQPQALSITLWSLAKLGYDAHDGLVKDVGEHLAAQQDSFELGTMSMALWGYANIAKGSGRQRWRNRLAAAVSEKLKFKVTQASGVGLAHLLGALAELRVVSKPVAQGLSVLVELTTAHLVGKVSGLRVRHMALILWSCATLNHQPPTELLDQLSQELQRTVKEVVDFIDVHRILWACRKLGVDPGDSVLDSLAQMVLPLFQGLAVEEQESLVQLVVVLTQQRDVTMYPHLQTLAAIKPADRGLHLHKW